MRLLHRPLLDVRCARWLQKQTLLILRKPLAQRGAEATRLWASASGNKARTPFKKVEELLKSMTTGRQRCMYCEDSQGSAMEHFEPRSRAPEKTFDWENLLYACAHCNSNEKRNQFPTTPHGDPLLINPSAEDPLDHLLLVPRSGRFEARLHPQTQESSPKGTASINVYGLHRQTLTAGRRDAWDGLQEYIIRYDQHLSAQRPKLAAGLRRIICNAPFSCVLVHLLQTASRDPVPISAYLQPACIAALHRRPEIADWPHQSP